MRSDHRHLTAYQIGCEIGQSVGLVLRPAILDRHILALDVAEFTKSLAECGQIACSTGRLRAAEEPDHRHRWLLRPRRQRPCRRAAEQGDELAPADHSITPVASASMVGGIAMPSAFAVLRLMAKSNLVDTSTGSSAGFSPLRMRPV